MHRTAGAAPVAPRTVVALLVTSAALGACGGSMQVGAMVQVPPELAVRVFPEVAVVPGGAPEDLEVADALADHLALAAPGDAARGGARVSRIDEAGLDRRRANGRFGPACAVLRVETRVIETSRPTFVSQPETVCTAWGCQTYRRTVMQDLPVVMGTVVLRVFEARTDRLLQELRLEEREEGSDSLAMRLRVVERLRRRAVGAVDPGHVEVRVELLEVADGEASAALRALREGHPREAREALERIVRRHDFESRALEVRARLLFDLGQAERLEARVLPDPEQEAALARAEDTLRRALRARPEEAFARALSQIAEERAARERMQAHRAAASHNFALDRSPSVPPPPPGYADGT